MTKYILPLLFLFSFQLSYASMSEVDLAVRKAITQDLKNYVQDEEVFMFEKIQNIQFTQLKKSSCMAIVSADAFIEENFYYSLHLCLTKDSVGAYQAEVIGKSAHF